VRKAGNEGGPYVQLALFAEKFIRGAQTGALSIINMVDAVGVRGDNPNQMPPFQMEQLMVFVNLWAGDAKGRYEILLRPQEPSGLYGDPLDIGPVNFVPTAKGVDIARQMPPYEITEEGTTWFDVLLAPPGEDDGQLLTRIPFEINYQPTVTLRR
jgi:hypothetical protein